jgi:hypothetical protein
VKGIEEVGDVRDHGHGRADVEIAERSVEGAQIEHRRLIASLRGLQTAVEAGHRAVADVAAVELHLLLHARPDNDHVLLDALDGPDWRDVARRHVAEIIVRLDLEETDLLLVAHDLVALDPWRQSELVGRVGRHAGATTRE